MTIGSTKAEVRREVAGSRFGTLARLATSPSAWFAGFILAVLVGLLLPLRLPLGPNYWDTAVYFDAAQRIRMGQVPSLDFFAPIGPLDYYLVAGLARLFPQAHPMLLANWGVLPVALPLLALAIADIVRHGSRGQALALLLPFLLFASLPINLLELYPLPGFDGYGHYNRHIALLLYILVVVLLYVRSRALLTALTGALMLTLFLVKVTGAVSGAMLVGFAVLTGRMRLREAVAAAAAVIAVLAVLDLATGLVRAYVADILTLLALNTGALLPRFLTVASTKLNVVAPTLSLLFVLLFAAWRNGGQERFPRWAGEVATSPTGWLAATMVALAFFETQNTGSLEFIGAWPVMWLILMQWRDSTDRLRPAVLVLLFAAVLPSAVIFLSRAGRAILAAPTYDALVVPDTGTLGRVSIRSELAERAPLMLDHYTRFQEAHRDLSAKGQLSNYILYSAIDYQATWLLELDEGVRAVKAWEATNGRRLDGFFTLDFVDSFNWLLDRRPPRHVPIGIDPARSNPELEPPALEALARTDAILAPKCPQTTARQMIAAHFAPALAGRTLVALSPCWDMHLRR